MNTGSAARNQPLGHLEELMIRYQQGDSAAAEAIVGILSPLLFRFFLMQVSSRRAAEDLLQDTWLRIHAARHTHRPGDPVLPWVYAIARHVRIDHYRRSRRRDFREQAMDPLPERPAVNPPPSSEPPDVQSLLATLPPSQREVITMLKIVGMTLEEVARATSSSIGSVKQKAHRAYEKLRAVLGETR